MDPSVTQCDTYSEAGQDITTGKGWRSASLCCVTEFLAQTVFDNSVTYSSVNSTIWNAFIAPSFPRRSLILRKLYNYTKPTVMMEDVSEQSGDASSIIQEVSLLLPCRIRERKSANGFTAQARRAEPGIHRLGAAYLETAHVDRRIVWQENTYSCDPREPAGREIGANKHPTCRFIL